MQVLKMPALPRSTRDRRQATKSVDECESMCYSCHEVVENSAAVAHSMENQMARTLLFFVVLAPMIAATGCGSDDDKMAANLCEAIMCSGHGKCLSDDAGNTSCRCDPGYTASGTTCVPSSNACSGVTCSGHGTCQMSGANATCACDPGYSHGSDAMTCVAASSNPCAGVTCSGHGTCQVNGASATCACDPGYSHGSDAMTCIAASSNPCAGVTCSGHGTCQVNGANATCVCDPGFAHALDAMTCVSREITFGNVGCPSGSYHVTESDDGTEISVAFDSFVAAPSGTDELLDLASCSIAVNFDVPPGMTVGAVSGRVEGAATIPNVAGAQGVVAGDYFLGAGSGSGKAMTFDQGYKDAFRFEGSDPTVAWSPCGTDTIVRANLRVIARRPDASAGISVSVKSTSLRWAWKKCQ
jgi:hypothetical protein